MASGHEDTFHHVRDFSYFETSETIGIGMEFTNKYGDRVFGFPLPKIPLPWGGEFELTKFMVLQVVAGLLVLVIFRGLSRDRKSTRLNSSHVVTSYAVFCLKKKN